jgi:hypothetical protein
MLDTNSNRQMSPLHKRKEELLEKIEYAKMEEEDAQKSKKSQKSKDDKKE